MDINFNTLKLEFKEYLINRGVIEIDSNEAEDTSEINIFSYKSEFKEFVEEQYEVDLESFSSSLLDLSQLEIQDGQIIYDEISDEFNNEEDEINAKNTNFMISFLNSLFKEEDFLSGINTDDDMSLDDQEIMKFLVYASSQDDESEKLSFEDVLFGFENTEKGEYKPDDVSLDILDNLEEEIDTEETEDVAETPSAPSGGSSSNNISYTPTKPPVENKELTPSEMSDAQLEEARNTKMSDLDTAKTNLQNVTEQSKTAMADQKTALQELFAKESETNQEAKLALVEYYTKIGDAKLEISEQKAKIADYEVKILDLEMNLNVANAQLSSYQSAKASISPDDPDKASKEQYFQSVIDGLQNDTIPKLNNELEAQKTAKEEAEAKLPELEEKLSGLEELSEEQQAQFQTVIQEFSDEQYACLEKYVALIGDLDNASQAYSATLEASQKDLKEIEAEIILRNDKKAQNEASMSANLFTSSAEGFEWIEWPGGTNLPYGILAPKNLDQSGKIPVMVFLHGMGQIGANETRAAKGYIDNIFNDYELDAFNGLIICPQSKDYWNGQAANIDEILNQVASQYNIDPDNIVIAGHSRGGTGVLEVLDSDVFKDGVGFEFKSGVCFAGYPQWTSDQNPGTKEEKIFDLAAPVYVYGDAGTIKSEFDENVSNVVEWFDRTDVQHGVLAREAFREDFDGNGKADIFEKLFGVQDQN